MRTLGFAAIGSAVVALIAFLVIGLLAPHEVAIQHRRFIAAEPPEVFAVLAEHDRWPKLWDDVTRVEILEGGDGQAVGTKRRLYFEEGTRFTEVVTAYEPPYDLHFSGIETPGVTDWQVQIALQPGARGGTVATLRIGYEPDGFVRRVLNELGFQKALKHTAMRLLDNVARELGVENVTVDEYAIRMAQARARKASAESASAKSGHGEPLDGAPSETTPATGPTEDEGAEATPVESERAPAGSDVTP